MTPHEADKVVASVDEYIINSSKFSSLALKTAGVKFEMFEGSSLELTDNLCAQIYRDIVKDMFIKGCTMGQRHCLFGMLIPAIEDNKEVITLELGIVFPNLQTNIRVD